MNKKLEIGGQRNIKGWDQYGISDSTPKNIMFDELDYPDDFLEEVYWSHVIEHIPYCRIEEVLVKIIMKLKTGGKFRTVCPDMGKMIEAYNNKDTFAFTGNRNDIADQRNANHWGSMANRGIYPILGIGGMLMANIVGSEHSTNPESLVTDSGGRVYGGMSHLAGYDSEMMINLMKHIGFSKVEETDLEPMDPHQMEGQLCINAYK